MSQFLEDYIPVVMQSGLNTQKDASFGGSVSFSGTQTVTGGIVENAEVVTATNVITASESGKTFYLNAAAGFLSTLPAPAIGLFFRFVVRLAPTSVGYTIATNASANIIKGMFVERAGGAGVASAVGDLITLVANQSIAGDWFEIRSDGTSWFVHGMVDVAAGVTIAST